MRGDLLAFVVETVSQVVIIKLMKGKESHRNGTAIGVQSVVQYRRVVCDISGRDGTIKSQEHQLSYHRTSSTEYYFS